MEKHKDKVKEFGMLHEYRDSEEYLIRHPQLACEDTANYLVIWCIDLEVEEVSINWREILSTFTHL